MKWQSVSVIYRIHDLSSPTEFIDLDILFAVFFFLPVQEAEIERQRDKVQYRHRFHYYLLTSLFAFVQNDFTQSKNDIFAFLSSADWIETF